MNRSDNDRLAYVIKAATGGLFVVFLASPSYGQISGSGTPNKIAKFTNTTVIGDASCTDDGTDFDCAAGLNLNLKGTGRLKMPGGKYAPSILSPEWRMLTTGSSSLAAGLYGIRKSALQLFDNKTGDLDTAMIELDQVARYCDAAGTEYPTVDEYGNVEDECRDGIIKTGMQVFSYAVPEGPTYGGENSAGLFVQTGGGNGLTVYKASKTLRPDGWYDYSNARAGAMEVGTTDGSWAGLFEAGISFHGVGTDKSSNAIVARIDNNVSKGILIAPGDGATFDTRRALQVGMYNINAPNSSVKFSLRLDGRTTVGSDSPSQSTGTTMLHVAGSEANNQVGAGDLAAMKLMNTSIADGRLAELQFGTSSTSRFAAIAGVLRDNSNNTSGDLVFGVRPSTTDSNLIAGMTLTRSANLQLAGNFTPVYDGAQDLGSSTSRWRNLYVSGSFTTTRTSAGAAIGEDRPGASLRLDGGTGTGLGPGGDVTITTSPSVMSGTKAQKSVNRVIVVAQGKPLLDEMPVGLFEIAMTSGAVSGGTITATVQVSSGADRQVLTHEVLWACVNGVGGASCTLSSPRAAEHVTAGSIEGNWTWSWDPATNKITIELTADSSLIPNGTNGCVVYLQIHNNGEQVITIL